MYQELNEILFYLSLKDESQYGSLGLVIRLNVFSSSNRFDYYLNVLIEEGNIDRVNTRTEEINQKLNTNLVSFILTKRGLVFIREGGYNHSFKKRVSLSSVTSPSV